MLNNLTRTMLLAAVFLTACDRSGERQIAVIPKSVDNVFWQSVHAGVIAAGREFHLKILWDGPERETDYSRGLQIFDAMLARHVDGIAVAAQDRNAMNNSLDRAAREKVPVTVFDSGVDSTNYMTFVATDNFAAGQMAARKLGELIHRKGAVAMVEHAPGSFSTMDRERGFEDVLGRELPDVHIVARQFSGGDRAKAMAAAENILTAHPAIDGFFGSSEPCSVGASQALKSRGLAGKVRLVGFDASEGLIEDLKTGAIDALVVQDPFRMGYEAVKTLADKLNGKNPPRRIDLDATVVTKADLARPEVHKLLYR